jgi:hypothetical protein
MIVDNPFLVLGLSPDVSRIEMEREAQKLLGMLELGFSDASTYMTPLGPKPRDAESVRAAVATLRDPYQRLLAELWVRHAPKHVTQPQRDETPKGTPGLRKALGWRP